MLDSRLLSQIRKSDGATCELILSWTPWQANILYIYSRGRTYPPSVASSRRRLGLKSASYTLFCPIGGQARVGWMKHDTPTSSKQPYKIPLKTQSFYMMGGTEMYVFHSILSCDINIHLFAQGRTNNLTHLSIADLCTSFYYGTERALGHLFPEVFGKEVPTPAVALVAAAVSA